MTLEPKGQMMPASMGSVYLPPHKMKALLEQMKTNDESSEQNQKYMWEMLRKSLNGIVNKVNVANISNIVMELFNENLLRGRGLLTKSILKAQTASPTFTHVYACLVGCINTKLPDVARLLLHRVVDQFRKAFKRNNKLVCKSCLMMIAHLMN